MKTGIVTFPKAINYGTALQAAALCKALSRYSSDVIFPDHACELIDKSNAIFDLGQAKDPKYVIAHGLNLSNAVKRKKNFDAFADKFIPVKKFAADECDITVAGSDQIWNYNLTGNDTFYFLDYEKKNNRKVAYAGSFGLSAVDEKYREDYRRLFNDFDFLSVRENTAADIIEDITGSRPPVVLDPTLLLTREDWKELSDKSFTEKDYIFVYTVFNSEKLWDFAYRLSKKTGLPIKTVSYSKLHRHEADYSFTAGPDGWVARMMNASFVVTNSFHGFAFSVNFNKQFFFELPPAKSGVSSRLSDMAKLCGIPDREISLTDIDGEISYGEINRIIEEKRIQSKEFISSFMK